MVDEAVRALVQKINLENILVQHLAWLGTFLFSGASHFCAKKVGSNAA
jgi:hypothetical protein